MRDVKKQLNTACRLCLVFLLVSSLLCGCGAGPTPANTEPAPNPKPAATPTSTPTPAPDPEELARQQRLAAAKDGFVWEDGWLEAIDVDGNLLTDCYIEEFAATMAPMSYLQFQRIGYFNVDTTSTPDHPVFNKTVGLKDTWAKK